MTNQNEIKKGIPNKEISREMALNFVPMMDGLFEAFGGNRNPFALYSSLIRILREKWLEVKNGEIKEEVYLAYFQELFSYQITQQQFQQNGRFEVNFIPIDDERYAITSSVILHPTKASKPKGFGYEFEEGN